MFVCHDGEIILKEKYGSSATERLYVKPPEQHNIVVIDEGKSKSLYHFLTHIFLPHGYPDSVSKDYLTYQIWDTAQAFCSTITGTLATQEVLRGVGVGDSSATPLAATITWVLKEGCGHLGRIVFAYSHGTYLDAYSKKWRLYADTLNDAAMCIEIALPLFRNYTMFALCVSTTMKAIVGVAGGATRIALTQHHAVRGNMADVSAKDSAQETAVNFVASFTAVFLISIFGQSISLFILMLVLHIIFNYFAVRSVCLKTLNEPRFMQIIFSYLKHEVVCSPCDINKREPIMFYQMGANLLDLKVCGFRIKLGCSMKKLLNKTAKSTLMNNIKSVYSSRNYFLYSHSGSRKMYVLLRREANVDDVLCAYFHATLLSMIICAINDVPLAAFEHSEETRPFELICKTLHEANWSRELVEKIGPSGFIYDPSYELLKYVDVIVQKEWHRIKDGLGAIGWDLSKHLLVVDEWRVTYQKTSPKETTSYHRDIDNDIERILIPSSIILPDKSVSNETDKQKSIKED